MSTLAISPKPPSSGMHVDFQVLDQLIQYTAETDTFLKVVVMDEDDLAFARRIHLRYPEIPFVIQVGNTHLSESDDEALAIQLLEDYRNLVDRVMTCSDLMNVRVLPQLHTYLWGNKRGV
ncbi:MAG: hypothetical protein ACRC5C_11590 [Bacilli bacterium]